MVRGATGSGRILLVAGLLTVGLFPGVSRSAEPAPVEPPAVRIAIAADRLTAALDDLDAWLGAGENGDRWRRYLRIESVRAELAKTLGVDPAIATRSLQQFRSGADGLQLKQFVAARAALAAWITAIKQSYGRDLSQLAWASRYDFVPLTDAEFAAIRGQMRDAARQLEAELRNTPFEADWKKFLHWEDLEPHLVDGFKATPHSLAQLNEVRNRIHANQPGLERHEFVNLARAIDRYRGVVSWVGGERDRRADYERLMLGLKEQLVRHDKTPTTETAWKIARYLGVIQGIGQSPELMAGFKTHQGLPNASVKMSANLIRSLPNARPNGIEPVRDCILGTTIRGTALTAGHVEYSLLPADDQVKMAVYFHGGAQSRTTGFHKPVRIHSTGRTSYTAVKHLSFDDEAFAATPAVADVETHTTIHSIHKTGGAFGKNLIEKIAWQRAGEQKGQAEQISSGHTRARVTREFDETTAAQLAKSRERYLHDVRAPLIRRGYSPDILEMSSSPERILIESAFGVPGELEAGSPPPDIPPHDISLQIHESAVNNYLPVALAAATIAQEAAGDPPKIRGNVPPWFKGIAVAKPKVAQAVAKGVEAAAAPVEAVKQAADAIQKTPEDEKPIPPPFRAWSITLNAERPASVRFDDNKLILRIRAAQLSSEGEAYENWDFIVKYKITRQGNRIVLKRDGDIEVFPTGFDPAWDKKMSSQQSGFRSTLAKNMNARAQAGQGFPDEIPIEPIRFSRFGMLVLDQLACDDGWLTVGWRLP